jgi:hypothetical protein
MATAIKTPERPAHVPAKHAEPGALDYLQRALEDLNRAREHAQRDARSGIDDATERIRAASDEARLELGRAVIRAQRTPEALTELTREIRLRKAAMKEEAA